MDKNKKLNEDISEEQLSELILNSFGEDKKNNRLYLDSFHLAY